MENLKDALAQIGRLKDLKRSGWVRMEIPEPETVSGHSFRCAIIALLGSDLGSIDRGRLVQLTLVHDLAESNPEVGDITPFDGIDKATKQNMERAAMIKLCDGLANGQELLALWEEFESGETEEAKIAQQIDQTEMALQAIEYKKKYGTDLSAFIEHARKRVTHPTLRALID